MRFMVLRRPWEYLIGVRLFANIIRVFEDIVPNNRFQQDTWRHVGWYNNKYIM